MVSGVQSSIGSSAYTKTAQLNQSPQSVEQFKKQMQSTVKEGTSPDNETAPTQQSPLKEMLKPENQDTGFTKQSPDTQMENKSNVVTLQAEQTRGSLLDIAV